MIGFPVRLGKLLLLVETAIPHLLESHMWSSKRSCMFLDLLAGRGINLVELPGVGVSYRVGRSEP